MTNNKVDLHNDVDLKPNSKEELKILGFNLTNAPTNKVVFIYAIAIFVIYITIFIIQESVFKKNNFNFGGLITFLQFATYAIYALIHRRIDPKLAHERRAPFKFYFCMAFYSVAGTAASSYALSLLSFPLWVLAKSMRVVGVMIAGIFMLKKKYKMREYVGVVLLVVGLAIFTLGDIRLLPSFSPLGILLVLVSLSMNALEGNMQEKGLTHYRASENEMVIYSYGLGALQLLPYLLWKGEFVEGMSFLKGHIYVILQLVVLCSLGYYGILLVLSLCKISSALTTVIVTSTRKALTVIFSFIVFAKPFSFFYIFGFSTFFFGVFLNVYSKNKDQMDALAKELITTLFRFKSSVKQMQVEPILPISLPSAPTVPVASKIISPLFKSGNFTSPTLRKSVTDSSSTIQKSDSFVIPSTKDNKNRLKTSAALSSSGGLAKRRLDTVSIVIKAAA